MNIREYKPSDIYQLKEIHEKYYKEEFDLPDFLLDYHCAFSITDAKGTIVTSGGIKPIAELVAITNKDFKVRDRRTALLDLLQATAYIGRKWEYSELHTFIRDENWYNQLIKSNYFKPRGNGLVADLEI